MPKHGDQIILWVQEENGNEDLFIQATCRDGDGNLVLGSPFLLPSVAEGLYQIAKAMPNFSFTAQFIPYTDSGLTLRSPSLAIVGAEFELDTGSGGGASAPADIVVIIADEPILVTVVDDEEMIHG